MIVINVTLFLPFYIYKYNKTVTLAINLQPPYSLNYLLKHATSEITSDFANKIPKLNTTFSFKIIFFFSFFSSKLNEK